VLDHPHICTIHEIGEHEGKPYVAMQYLEGQTLKHRIGTKPLETDELLREAHVPFPSLALSRDKSATSPLVTGTVWHGTEQIEQEWKRDLDRRVTK